MTSVILLKNSFFRQGGLEKYARRLSLAFKDQGCKVTVLTTGDIKEKSFDPSIEIISHPLKSRISFLKVKEFDLFCSNYLKDHPATIVLGLDRNSFQTHLRAGNGSHRAYLNHRILQEGNLSKWRHFINPLHRTILKLEKKAFEHPELLTLFTNSKMVKNEILEFYRVDPKKISVIHNGVEWKEMENQFIHWQEQREKCNKELNLNPDTFKFLFVGHNYRRKGLENLLYALTFLPHKEFQLLVVGKEKKMNHFHFLVDKLKLEKNVRFFGETSNVIPFYQLSDSLVIPSFYDPFANVTLEALAMGAFVVSSKFNGGHEILNKENGAIIQQLDSIESIAASLKIALMRPKTPLSAAQIRNSIQSYDFSNQLTKFTDACLN